MYGWHSVRSVFLEDPGVYLNSITSCYTLIFRALRLRRIVTVKLRPFKFSYFTCDLRQSYFLFSFLCPEYQRQKSTSNKPSDSEEVRAAPLDLRAAGLGRVLRTAKSLATNGPFIFGVLYSTCDSVIIQGFIAFGAKYFQQQFGLTATMAGIVFG